MVIDAGGPCAPLVEAAERHGLDVQKLLLTHHHHDHVAEASAWEGVEVLAHPIEAELLDGVDRTIEPGDTIEVGGLRIETLLTPGHTAGMLNFVVNGGDVFTGDTLFKGSVGGVRAPGSTSFADLRGSIMDVLMALPHDTRVHPGHTDPTTIGDEWDQNAFVAYGAASTRRAASPAGWRTRRRRSCSGRRTTTAGTRPGCAGATAATTSCRAAA